MLSRGFWTGGHSKYSTHLLVVFALPSASSSTLDWPMISEIFWAVPPSPSIARQRRYANTCLLASVLPGSGGDRLRAGAHQPVSRAGQLRSARRLGPGGVGERLPAPLSPLTTTDCATVPLSLSALKMRSVSAQMCGSWLVPSLKCCMTCSS